MPLELTFRMRKVGQNEDVSEEGSGPDTESHLSPEVVTTASSVVRRPEVKVGSVSKLGKRAGQVLGAVIGGMAVVAAACTGVLLWRRRGT